MGCTHCSRIWISAVQMRWRVESKQRFAKGEEEHGKTRGGNPDYSSNWCGGVSSSEKGEERLRSPGNEGDPDEMERPWRSRCIFTPTSCHTSTTEAKMRDEGVKSEARQGHAMSVVGDDHHDNDTDHIPAECDVFEDSSSPESQG